jgi:CDP-diacylglycerol--glycerol-3-phosphate 3-phosphatidyltransferase
MISIYKIKPQFQALLRPILEQMHKKGIQPNTITWMAILLSVFCGIFCWMHPILISLIILPIALFIRMALNALDGMMARTYQLQSKGGEMLNEIGDVFSDFVMFAPLYWLFQAELYSFITFLFLSILNEFAGIMGKIVSGTRRYDGPMGKSDRALIIGLASIILFCSVRVLPYMQYLFYLLDVLLLLSTFIRIKKSLSTE